MAEQQRNITNHSPSFVELWGLRLLSLSAPRRRAVAHAPPRRAISGIAYQD